MLNFNIIPSSSHLFLPHGVCACAAHQGQAGPGHTSSRRSLLEAELRGALGALLAEAAWWVGGWVGGWQGGVESGRAVEKGCAVQLAEAAWWVAAGGRGGGGGRGCAAQLVQGAWWVDGRGGEGRGGRQWKRDVSRS